MEEYLAQPQPFAFGRVGDADPGQEFVAPHAEIAGRILLFGERITRFAQRGDIGERVGTPGVGQRAVEIQKDQFYFGAGVCHVVAENRERRRRRGFLSFGADCQSNDCMPDWAMRIRRWYSVGESSIKK